MRLSRFRSLEQLPGARASGRLPRRVRVRLRGRASRRSSRTTISTGRRSASGRDHVPEPDDLVASRPSATSSAALAAARIKAGEWPWTFFCWPEERPRPVFPSAFQLLAADGAGRSRRARGALPGLREGLGESRHARARRRAVRERPRGGGGRAPVRRRRRRGARASSTRSCTRRRSTRGASRLD